MVDRQLAEIKRSEEVAKVATNELKSWILQNVKSLDDVKEILNYQLGTEVSNPDSQDLAERYAFSSIGYKRCHGISCGTPSNYDGGWIMNTNFGVGGPNDRDIDCLSIYCDGCRRLHPLDNGELSGRDLEKYVAYSKYLYDTYVTSRIVSTELDSNGLEKKSSNRRGLPDKELFWSVKNGVDNGMWSKTDSSRSGRLRALEYGMKRCYGLMCSDRERKGDGSAMVDVREFGNCDGRDGLHSECKACVHHRYELRKKKKALSEEEVRLRVKQEREYYESMGDAFKNLERYYECLRCHRQLTIENFDRRKTHNRVRLRSCIECDAADLRRKNLGGSAAATLCSTTYRIGDKVTSKNIYHMFLDNDLAYSVLTKYAIDVDRGILVHRTAYSKGRALRAPGDEAYSLNTNGDKCLPVIEGQKALKTKYILSVLYDLTDPNGTIVHRDRNRFDSRPQNLVQWNISDPVCPYDKSAKALGRGTKYNEELRKENMESVKGINGEPVRWYRSSTLDSLDSHSHSILTGPVHNKGDLCAELDSARRIDKITREYIRECDRKYLAHARESFRVATETRGREYYSLGNNGRDRARSILSRVEDAISLASI